MKLGKAMRGKVNGSGGFVLEFDEEYFSFTRGGNFIKLYLSEAKWLVNELSEAIVQIEKEPSCQ